MLRPRLQPRGPSVLGWLILLAAPWSLAQSPGKAVHRDSPPTAENAARLAESGHCAEALGSLKKSLGQLPDKDLQRKVGLDGVHCAMTLNQPRAAIDFLQALLSEFPQDPEVLYVAVHAYSDLSTLAAQQLAQNAPSSPQAHELLAESYEMQGKWDEAEKEYRLILKQDPKLPGIHFRLGRLILSRPGAGPEVSDQARQEFEQELRLDPSNAAAECVLGELARQHQQFEEAVNHFSRAAQLDSHFSEAYLGLGISLIAVKRYADAIPPLETAVKLEPQNPDARYNLATAYTRAGRKQDGQREFAIHQKLVEGQSTTPEGTPTPASNEQSQR